MHLLESRGLSLVVCCELSKEGEADEFAVPLYFWSTFCPLAKNRTDFRFMLIICPAVSRLVFPREGCCPCFATTVQYVQTHELKALSGNEAAVYRT